nr:hypothetical protein [Cupriavidus basilensis]
MRGIVELADHRQVLEPDQLADLHGVFQHGDHQDRQGGIAAPHELDHAQAIAMGTARHHVVRQQDVARLPA